MKSKTGGPLQVFTPFWRHCKSLEGPADRCLSRRGLQRLAIGRSLPAWVPGSAAACTVLDRFLAEGFDEQPWAAPAAILEAAGVSLGEHYSRPLVDHDVARREALRALTAMKAK